MFEVIQELAVSIGALVDEASFRRALQLSEDVKRGLGGIAAFAQRNQLAFAAMGAAALAAFALPLRAASSFEDAFLGVIKVTEGLGEGLDSLTEEGKKVREQFEQLARTVPIPIEQLLRFGAVAGQLGVANENLAKFAEVIARLSVSIEGIEPETAALAIARLDTVINKGRGDFDRFGSALVALGNNFAALEGPILTTANYLQGFAQLTGMSIPKLLAWATAAQQVGAEGSAVATALQKIAIEMRKALSEGSDALNLFAETAGMSASQFQKAFEKDASSAVLAFIRGLRAIEKRGGDSVALLDELGLADARLIRETLKLAGGIDELEKALRVAQKAWEENRALLDESNRRFSALTGQAGLLNNAIRELARRFGEPFLKPAKAVVGALKDAALAVSDFLLGLGPLGEKLAMAGGAATLAVAAFSGFMLALGAVGRTLRFVSEGLAVFGLNTRRLLAPVRLLGRGLGALGRLTIQALSSLGSLTLEVTKAVTATGRLSISLLGRLLPALRAASVAALTFGRNLLVAGVSAARAAIPVLLRLAATALPAVAAAFSSAAASASAFAAALLANPITWLVAGLTALGGALYLLVTRWDEVKEAAVRAWEWIKGAWGRAADFFASIGGAIGQALTRALSGAWGWADEIEGLLAGLFERVSDWLGRLVQGVAQALSGLPERARGWLAGLFEALTEPFRRVLQWIAERFDLGKVLGEAIAKAKDFLQKPLEAVAGFVKSFWPFSPAERGPLRDIAKAGEGLIREIAEGVGRAEPLLRRAVERAASLELRPPTVSVEAVQRIRQVLEPVAVAGLEPAPAPAAAGVGVGVGVGGPPLQITLAPTFNVRVEGPVTGEEGRRIGREIGESGYEQFKRILPHMEQYLLRVLRSITPHPPPDRKGVRP